MHSLSICAQLGTLILQRRGKKLDARVKRFYSFTPFSLSSLPPWETLQLHLHRGNDDSAIFNLAGAIISSFSSLPPPTLSLSLSLSFSLSIIILPGFIFILAIITGHEARGTSRKLTTECRVIFTRFPRRNIGRCWGLA